MKLFHWKSHALEGYRYGNIMVMAENVDEARCLAEEQIEKFISDDHNSVHYRLNWWDKEDWDEFDKDNYKKFIDSLRKDLAKPPIDNSGVVYIEGGD